MTPPLQLWYAPGACSLAVHIVLRRANIPFETTFVAVRHGAPEGLRLINPKMKIPILVVDKDWVITEVPAIMTAIAQMVPDQKLLGTSDKEVVQTYEWMNWLSGTLHGEGFGMHFRPGRFIDDVNMHEAVQRKGQESIQNYFEYIEEKLTGVHAVGDAFTVVDASLYVYYRWGVGETSIDMVARYPKYSKLVAELSKDHALREAVDAEGLDSYDPTVEKKQ